MAKTYGVQVYSPTRSLPVRPTGTLANAGTARNIARPRPRGQTAPPGVAQRINVPNRQPQFGPMALGGGNQFNVGGGQSPAGGGTMADQILARHRNAQPQQQGNGGGLLNDLRGALGVAANSGPGKAIIGALDVLSMPRRAILSTIHEASDLIGGGGTASWDDWKEQFQDKEYGVGQYVDTGNIWLDRVLGFAGDVATDPLTYLAGSSKLAGVGREARLAAARAATSAGWDSSIVDRIAQRGTSFLSNAERQTLRTATNEAGEHIGVNLLNRGYYFDIPFGPEIPIPGTSRIEPALSAGVGRVRSSLARSSLGTYLRSRVSTPQSLEAAVERLVTGKGQMSAAEAAERLNYGNGLRVGHNSTLQMMSERARVLIEEHGDDTLNNMIHAAENGADNEALQYFARGADLYEELGGTYAHGRRADYVPHLTRPEAEALNRGLDPTSEEFLSGIARGTSANDISARLLSRKLEPGEKFIWAGKEVQLTDDLSIKGINEAYAKVFPGQKLLEDNFATIAERYSKDLAKDAGQLRAWKNVKNSRSGLVRALDDVSDWKIDEPGMALKDGTMKEEVVDALRAKRDYATQLRDAQRQRLAGIQGVLGIHMHEALADLKTVGQQANDELVGLLDEEQRLTHFVGAVGDDGVKTPGVLETRVNGYLGDLNNRAAELDAKLADISVQAAREREMYVAEQARNHEIGRIETDVRKYTALVREAKLMEERANVTMDQTALENVRNQLHLTRTKAHLLEDNLDDESFLNLAAGPPEPAPLEGVVRPKELSPSTYDPANYDPVTGAMRSPTEMERRIQRPMTDQELRAAGKASPTRSPGQVRDEAATARYNATKDKLSAQTTADIKNESIELTKLERARDQVAYRDAGKIAHAKTMLDEAQSEYAKVEYELAKLKGHTDPTSRARKAALESRLEDMADDLGQLGHATFEYEQAKREVDAANAQVSRTTERLESLKQRQLREARDYDAAHPPGSEPYEPEALPMTPQQETDAKREVARLRQERARVQRTKAGQDYVKAHRELETTTKEIQRLESIIRLETNGPRARFMMDAEGNIIHREMEDTVQNIALWDRREFFRKRVEITRAERDAAAGMMAKGERGLLSPEEMEAATQRYARASELYTEARRNARSIDGKLRYRGYDPEVEPNIGKGISAEKLVSHIDRLEAMRARQDVLERAIQLNGSGNREIDEQIGTLWNRLEEFYAAKSRVPNRSTLSMEDRLMQINQREAANLTKARQFKVPLKVDWEPVAPLEGEGQRAIAQQRQMMGRVGLYSDEDRTLLAQAYDTVRSTPRKARVRDNQAYQDALETIKDIEGYGAGERDALEEARRVARSTPSTSEEHRAAQRTIRELEGRGNDVSNHQAAALQQYNAVRRRIDNARAGTYKAPPELTQGLEAEKLTRRAAVAAERAAAKAAKEAGDTTFVRTALTDTTITGRARGAIEAAQAISDTQLDKLVTSGHIDQVMADDIGRTSAALDAALERYGTSPSPAAYRDVEYLISKSAIQSGTVNGLHLAHELGIEASDELGTYMLRREVAAELASVRTQLHTTTQNIVNGVEATKWAKWEGEVDELRLAIREQERIIAEQESIKRATGKYGDDIAIQSAKKRLRTANRDLNAKRLAYPQYGAYSDSLNMLAERMEQEFFHYSAAKTDEQAMSNLGRTLTGPAERRDQIQAAVQYNNMRLTEAEAQNTRIRRAIDKARREGKETVRYSPTTSAREAMFAPELERALEEGRIDERLAPFLRHKLERAKLEERKPLTYRDPGRADIIEPRKTPTRATDVVTSRAEGVTKDPWTGEWIQEDPWAQARREGAVPERVQGPRPVGQQLEREPLSQGAPVPEGNPLVEPLQGPPHPAKIRWDVPVKGKVKEVSLEQAEIDLKMSEHGVAAQRANMKTDLAELALLDGSAQQELDALTGAIDEATRNGVPDPDAMTEMLARKQDLQHQMDIARANTFGAEEMLNTAQDDGMALLAALTSHDPAVKIPVKPQHLPILRDLLGGMAQADLAATWMSKMDEIIERYATVLGKGRRIASDRGLDLQTDFDNFIDEVRESLGDGFAKAINDNVMAAMKASGSGDLDVIGVVREQQFRALASSRAAAKMQAQKDIADQMKLLGIATGSTAPIAVRQLGFEMSTEKLDGWALRKFLMKKFEEQGVDIRNALPDQQQSLRARLAQLKLMNKALGGRFEASELNDPEWLFTAMRVQAEGGDLAEELKLFERFQVPGTVGDVETRRFTQLQADLAKAIKANDSDAIDAAQNQIDQITGRAPRESSTEAIEATNEEARLQVARRASDNRLKIANLDKEIGAIDDLQQQWGGETLRSMIDDPNTPKAPHGKFTRAQRLQALRDANEAAAVADAMEDQLAGHQFAEQARAQAQWMSEKEQRWLNEPQEFVERANAIDDAMDAITPNSDVDLAGQRVKLSAQRDALTTELEQIEAEGRLIPAAGLTDEANLDIAREYEDAVAEFNNRMARYKGKAKKVPASEVPTLNSLGQKIIELKTRRDADVAARFAASMEGDANYAVRKSVEAMAAEKPSVQYDWRTVFQTGIPSRDAVQGRLAAKKLGRLPGSPRVMGERVGDQLTPTTRNYIRNNIEAQAGKLERDMAPIAAQQERMGQQLAATTRQQAELEAQEAPLAAAEVRGPQLDEQIAQQRAIAADRTRPNQAEIDQRFQQHMETVGELGSQVDPIMQAQRDVAQKAARVQERYNRELQRMELQLGDVRTNLESVRTHAEALNDLTARVERAVAAAPGTKTAEMHALIEDMRVVNQLRRDTVLLDTGVDIGKRRLPGGPIEEVAPAAATPPVPTPAPKAPPVPKGPRPFTPQEVADGWASTRHVPSKDEVDKLLAKAAAARRKGVTDFEWYTAHQGNKMQGRVGGSIQLPKGTPAPAGYFRNASTTGPAVFRGLGTLDNMPGKLESTLWKLGYRDPAEIVGDPVEVAAKGIKPPTPKAPEVAPVVEAAAPAAPPAPRQGPALVDVSEDKAIAHTETLLASAADAQLHLDDAAFDQRMLEQRLKQFEDGSMKIEPVVTRVIQDGWQQMAKDLFPDLGKGSDAVGVADGLAGALKNLSEALRQPESWKLIDQYTQFFKTYATMTPGFHVRNAMSGVFMNYVDGVKTRYMMRAMPLWHEYAENPGRFIESLATRPDGDKIRLAFDAVFGSGAGGQFVESGLGEAPSWSAGAYRRLMENQLTKWNRKAGSYVEGSLRLGMALDSIYRGASLDQALGRITKFHFDYTQVSRLDRQAKRFIPFWTFISRNLPLQVEQMWTRPRAYLIYQSFVRNFGEVPDPLTPDYWLAQGAFTMNQDAEHSNAPWYLAPDLPFTRVMEPIDALAHGDLGKALLSDINPLLAAPVEAYGAHQKFYTGQPIEGYSAPSGAMDWLTPIFQLLGQTEQGGRTGDTLVSNSAQHMARSLLPPLNLAERLTSGTGTREGRQDETLYRALGAPVYQLTPGVRQSTRNSRAAARRNKRDQQAELARS